MPDFLIYHLFVDIMDKHLLELDSIEGSYLSKKLISSDLKVPRPLNSQTKIRSF
jgi:hypothetical protein